MQRHARPFGALLIACVLGLAPQGCGRDPSAGSTQGAAGGLPAQGAGASEAPTAVDPVTEFSAAARTGRSADGTYEVTWEPIGGAIPDAEPFSIAVRVRRTDGTPLGESVRLRVDAEMPHHGHGMNLVPGVTRRGAGSDFVVDSMLFHMTGRWVLAVDVDEDGVMERTQWYVDIE
ncbi:MAG: hypothetical protein ACO3QC_02740 [Phycisphaerales bacterium]